jgi:nucleoside diphosphate kinase
MKNKPKINKEVTVQELKLKVEKLEKLLVICNARISQLTEFINENGLSVPETKDNLIIDNFNMNTKNNNNNILNINSDRNGNIDNNLISEYLLVNATNDLNEIEKKYSGILEKMNELEGEKSDVVSKLEEANLKIEDLQAIIEQKEKIEDDFEEKEEHYNKIINELSENLKYIQSQDIIKKNLKVIDKKVLGEFYNQMKDYTLGITKSKNKEVNRRIMDNLTKIINSNFNTQVTSIDKEILNQRLGCQRAIKLQILSNVPFDDYNDINDNYMSNNFSDDNLIKSVNEKNHLISKLENDMNEYKEKLKLLENKLSPDEKNLYKKIYSLEQNLKEVNKMYHLTLQEKCILKVENQILTKKIQKRNEKINSLNKEKNGLMEQFRDIDQLNEAMNNYLVRKNVVKVIRGGKQNHNINIDDKKTNY